VVVDFDMGKYALYVWGSYGATALAIGGLVLLSLRAHAKWKQQLEALQATAEKP
jgi:heme exporter protein D